MMETRSGIERTAGREGAGSTLPDRCAHNGLAMIHGVVGGYVARCLACQVIGPIRDTSEAARRALLRSRRQGHRDTPGS